jgi:hypothetical protein
MTDYLRVSKAPFLLRFDRCNGSLLSRPRTALADLLGKVCQGRGVAFRADDQGPSKSRHLSPSLSFLVPSLTTRSNVCHKILQTPTPRPGEVLRLRIASPPLQTDDDALDLIAALPGHTDMNTGLVSAGWEMWAFFQVLSIDNVLSIVEVRIRSSDLQRLPISSLTFGLNELSQIALSPNGRVLFHSRHPALLGMAVKVRSIALRSAFANLS